MSCTIIMDDVFSTEAEAAVLQIENPMVPSDGPVYEQLAARGGEELLREMARLRFLSVGRSAVIEPCGLPFRKIILVGAPRWQNGEANEFTVLHLCYRSIYRQAAEHGIRRIATPFLSTDYYGFPQEEAIRIAFSELRDNIETVFLAETPERLELSRSGGRKPRIVSYIGYYRDYAVFRLDTGFFAHVDLRPELRSVQLRTFYDPCVLAYTDPHRPPLAEEEIRRAQEIYDTYSW